jgi:CubicO group peptidase (beta-lactamase class C family)
LTAVDNYITTQMQAARIPGVALAIIQGEEIVYLQGYGVADPGSRPVTPQTLFPIASTVKSFTALAILQLVQAGQVELDAPVQRYLPWFQTADTAAAAHITVRHLLTHTSGLSEAAGNELPVSADTGPAALENRVRRLSVARLNRPVGERFEYSSANYDTLGLIVQMVSGQSYETYVQENILNPLAMRHTFTALDEAEPQGLATGYRSWFGFPVPFDAPRPRAYAPSGWSAASRAEDLARFALAQLNGGRAGAAALLNVSPEGFAAMHQPAVRSYSDTTFQGLGWSVATMSGVPLVSAGGDAMNFKTRLVLAPEQRLGVVVLTNMNSVNVNSGRFELHHDLLTLLLNQQPASVASGHYMAVYATTIFVLFISLLLFLDLFRLLWRQWRRAPFVGRQRAAVWLALPPALALLWALLLLLGLPQLTGRSLPFLLLYIPDFAYTLIVSALLALAWGVARAVVAWQSVARPGRSGHAAVRPQIAVEER